jgi:hypothetical protein
MGLKPRSLPPPKPVKTLHPVYPEPEEQVKPKEPISSTPIPIDWAQVLERLAPEMVDVHAKRGLGTGDTSLWFVQFANEKLKAKVINSLTGLNPVGWSDLEVTLESAGCETREDYLVLVGQILGRLISPESPIYRSARAWFGRTRLSDQMWFTSFWALKHTNWCGFNSDLKQFIHVLDQLILLQRSRAGSVAELFPLQKQATGMGWNLTPLRSLLNFAQMYRLSWRGVLLDLYQRQREGAYREPTWHWKYDLTSVVTKQLTATDKSGIPSVDQEWMAEAIYVLGLPGGVKLPDKVLYGLDFSNLERSDMRLIAITEQGQAVYRDWKGKVHSEGHPIPKLPGVVAWGKAIQIWMTPENYSTLLAFWYQPPKKCPWEWYERWGNNLYKPDGTAIQPDPKFRPPVQWLEAV